MDAPLKLDDLSEVQDDSWDARGKWWNIGLGLKMKHSDLEVIVKNYGDVDDQFREMLTRWLKDGKGCTRRNLCRVLVKPSVGCGEVAEIIREIYPGEAQEAIEHSQQDNMSLQPRGVMSRDSTFALPIQKSPTTSLGSQIPPKAFSKVLSPPSSAFENLMAQSESKKQRIEFPSPVCTSPDSTQSRVVSSKPDDGASIFGGNIDTNPQRQPTCTPSAESPIADTALFQSKMECSKDSIPPDFEPQPFRPRHLSLTKEIELRGYQKQLAGPGLQGKNYIVVAPTGTGKTLVAGYIIMFHLNKMWEEGKRPKVGFITPTRQLTFQQKMTLQKYIPGLRAAEVTGSSDTHMSPLVHGNEVDVIVCTAGKLRRELKTKSVEITDFSLIISDECHHAGRPSNYSDIMEFHIRLRLTQPSATLPQVVGLTASPGAGKGKSNMITVTNHLLSLCAIMDATSGFVATEKDNPELLSFHSDPKSYLEVKDEPAPNNPFFLCIYSAMEKLEHFVGNMPGVARGSTKYSAWLQSEKEAAESREVDERERISVLDQLSVYSLALITYNDFRHEDAVSVLDEVEEFKDPSSFEFFLSTIHKQLMNELSNLPKTPNPMLKHMEKILLDQFRDSPQSKGIFFVRAVKHTKYVTKWIQSSALAKFIRVTPITGYSRGGMEKAEQLRVLEGFRSGTYNLLASTSVLEEGLDVPECNFVIRYQNISNEIAQVQAKGRARAEDSRMYTIVSTKSNREYWYLIQEEKQRLVDVAVAGLKDFPVEQFLTTKQKQFIEERDREAQRIKMLRSRWPNADKVEIRCKKCNVLTCKGSEVFAYTLSADDHPHHVVPEKSFSNKYIKESHDKPDATFNFVKPYRILCRSPNCRSQWGVIAIWGDTGYQFPLLKCEKFLFKYHGDTRRFKKWKDIWFEAKSIQDWVNFEDDIVEEQTS